MADEVKGVRVGGAWIKESKAGRTWVSIQLDLKKLLDDGNPTDLEKVNLAMFENTKKEKENQPDYNITFFPKE